MQFFDRDQVPVPALLGSSQANRARRTMIEPMLYDNEKRSQTNMRTPRLDDDGSMRASLEELFRGRCAFCESDNHTTPYRFRPATEALPSQSGKTSHLYYAWLAHAWENCYAICQFCQPDAPHYFPVDGDRCEIPTQNQLRHYLEEKSGTWRERRPNQSGPRHRVHPPAERPLLLDPCVNEAFHRHVGASIDGWLAPLSTRGEATIAHFHLNRRELVEKRRATFVDRIALLQQWLESRPPTTLFDFQSMQFGGSWYLLVRRLTSSSFPKTGKRTILDALTPERMESFLAQIGRARVPILLDQLRLEYESRIGSEASREHGIDSGEAKPASRRPEVRLVGADFTLFKSLEQLSIDLPLDDTSTDDAITPALLVLGENATGKSSVLEGLALALASSSARRQVARVPRDFILDPLHLGAESIANDRGRDVSSVVLRLIDADPVELTVMADRFDASEADHQIPVFAYGAFRRYRTKRRSTAADRHIRNLFDNTELSNPQRWLFNLDADRFAMVVRALREILSIDGDFEVIRRDAVGQRCHVVTAMTDVNGEVVCTRTPLDATSSGFRSILAMVCDIMRGLMDPDINPGFENLLTARGVVLIDEIEAHLHPRWKMQIMSCLRRAFPRVTFIATTHDPLCLRGMRDGEVVVLKRLPVPDAQPWEPRVRIEAPAQRQHLSQLSIDQLLTSEFFELHTTSAPEIDRAMARIADLLTKGNLDEDEQRTVDEFRRDVAVALPVGDTEIHRIVQEAVADYLHERRALSEQRLRQLQADTKRRIIDALKSDSYATRHEN